MQCVVLPPLFGCLNARRRVCVEKSLEVRLRSMYWVSSHDAWAQLLLGILGPQPGIKPESPALENRFLSTG